MIGKHLQSIVRTFVSVVTILTMLVTPAMGSNPVHAEGATPTIMVSVQKNWVALFGFPANSQVELRLLNDGTTISTQHVPIDDIGCGKASFGTGDEPALSAGTKLQATVASASILQEVDFVPFSIDSIDYASRTVQGSGPASAPVVVFLNWLNSEKRYETTSETDGSWALTVPADAGEIRAGAQEIHAETYDTDGDGILTYPALPEVIVIMGNDWILLNNFVAGDSVAISILSGGQTVFTGTESVDSYGSVGLGPEVHETDLAPGMTVTVAATAHTPAKSLLISAFAGTSIDQTHLTGTAEPNLPLVVNIIQRDGFRYRVPVTAGVDGSWLVLFADYSITVNNDTSVEIDAYDADGDFTLVNGPQLIRMLANLTDNRINGMNIYGVTNVDLQIYDAADQLLFTQPGLAVTNNNFSIGFAETDVDLIPGMRIHFENTTANLERELILEDIQISSVDYEQDIVTGTAPAKQDVRAHATLKGMGASVDTASGDNGVWSADFSSSFDLTPDARYFAEILDADGDGTLMQLLNPVRIEADLTSDEVRVYNLSSNAAVTLTIGQSVFPGTSSDDGSAKFTNNITNIDLVPGMTILATDESTERSATLSLVDVSIASVDFDINRVYGHSVNGATVHVETNINGEPYEVIVTASETDGSWTADFAESGATLRFDQWIAAWVPDAGNNLTIAEAPRLPTIDAALVFGWIDLTGFPANAQVSVSVLPAGGGDALFAQDVNVDENGNTRLEPWLTNVDLVPGMQIQASVTEPEIAKSLVLGNLSPADLDADTDVVSGTADPNQRLQVYVSGNDGTGNWIDRGEWTNSADDGTYFVDFADFDIDLVAGMQASTRQFDMDGDSTFSEQWPSPQIDLWVDNNSVSSYNWPLGVNLTLTVKNGQEVTYQKTLANSRAPWNPGLGFTSFPLEGGKTLQPGYTVTVTDGDTERTSTVMNLLAPRVDEVNNRLSGTAAAGAVLWTNVCNEDGCAYRSITVGQDGNYTIEFDELGDQPDEQWIIDLRPGNGGAINWSDGSGNNTSRNWRASNPVITANAQYHWVNGNDWRKGDTVTLTVNGDEWTGTTTVIQAPWNPNDPNDVVAAFENVPFEAGDTLRMTNGDDMTRELVIAPVQVTQIDLPDSTLAGTSGPNASIEVCVNTQEGCVRRTTTADGAGAWRVDFSAPGSHDDEQQTLAFAKGTNGWAASIDADGDRNQADWGIPNPDLSVDARQGWVQSRGWPEGITVYLKINGVASGSAVVGPAYGNPQDIAAVFEGLTLATGDLVTVSNTDETISISTIISPIQVTATDRAENTLSGTANPNKTIQVCLNTPTGCAMRYTRSDSSTGNWTVDFDVKNPAGGDEGDGHLAAGSRGWAAELDDQGGATHTEWSIANPNITANWQGGWIHVRDWPGFPTLYLTIYEGETQKYDGSAAFEPAPWGGNELVARFENMQFKVNDRLVISDADGSGGTLTKELVIAPVAVTAIDRAASTLSGTADVGATVEVSVQFQDHVVLRYAQADTEGKWTVDFDAPGSAPGDSNETTTLALGSHGWASQADEDGDWSHVDWEIPNPSLTANVQNKWVQTRGWPQGTHVFLTINDGDPMETTVGPASWNPNEILGNYENVMLNAGDVLVIRNVDASISKTLTITPLAVTAIDLQASTVSGTANPHAIIRVCGNIPGNCVIRIVEADDQGRWTADFDVAGQHPEDWGTLTLGPGNNGWAEEYDADGDGTHVDWQIPNYTLQANVLNQEVHGWDWPEGAVVTITLDDPTTQAHATTSKQVGVDPDYCGGRPCFLMSDLGWTLAPGQVVSMSDGVVTKTITVRPIQVTAVDAATDQVRGTADPNSGVVVHVGSRDNQSRHVMADANGQWTADFAHEGSVDYEKQLLDLTYTDWGMALQLSPNTQNEDGTLQYWDASPVRLSAVNVQENVTANSQVGTFAPVDPAAQWTYALVEGEGSGDNSAFSIDGDELFLKPSPDYETKSQYSFRMKATNGANASDTVERVFIIYINDVNEAPLDITLDHDHIDENVSAGSVIGALTAADPEAGYQTFTFSLVAGEGDANNDAFTIDGNVLKIKASPNFEAKTSYNIRVRVSDSGSPALSLEKPFSISVNDLNEAPSDITLTASSVDENVAAGSVVANLTTQDPEAGSQTFTYTLVAGVGSADNAAFTIDSAALKIKASPNYEAKSSYSVRLRTTENGADEFSFEKQFTITVNDLNEAPTALILSAASLNENVAANTTVGTFSATDLDMPAQSFTFTLAGGEGDTDNSAFTLTGNTLKIKTSPDYEVKPSYSIRVRVTDSGAPAQWFEKVFTITVNNLNDAPSDLALSSSSIVENAPAGSRVVGVFSTTDQDLPAQSFTYSLVTGTGSADNAAFTLAGATLSIKAAPDYETKPAYTIRVRVTDNGSPNLTREEAFTITVTNQVEAPIVTNFSKSGLQDASIPFAVSDFADHFVDPETAGSSDLAKIQVTSLPQHGALKVGAATLAENDEIPASNLAQLVYVPAANYSGSDAFAWKGGTTSLYSTGSAQVSLTIGFVARHALQVSPAGDAKSIKAGATASYGLTLTNAGNVADSFTIALVGTPKWGTTFTPSQVVNLAAGGQVSLGIDVAVPANASGSDETVVKITSNSDPSKTVSIKLTTTAISAPVVPSPVLLSVSPASVNTSALQTTTLTLSGANFTQPMTVSVGGTASPSVTRNSSAEMVAAIPSGLVPGRYTVQVCNASGKCASLPDALIIVNNTPAVQAVYPNQGYNDAANAVTVQGYNLIAATVFTLVGAEPANQPAVLSAGSGQVQLSIPAGLAAGTYDLRACNAALCSALAGAYTSLDVVRNDFSASNDDLWTAPTTLREGNTIQLGLNVHRSSGIGLASVEVAFYRDDPNIPANKISPSVNPSTSQMAAGSAESVTAAWTPVGVTGAVKIYAVIDPDHLVTEASRANNVVSMTVMILPRQEKDETAPVIQSLTIAGGAGSTLQRTVNVALQAADNPGGSGLQMMNVVERVYNTSARQWVVAQETGWMLYQPSFQLTLAEQGGLHYLQVWVADMAGNTSSMAQESINYEPAQDSISAGQVRVYRLELTAGQVKSIQIAPVTGDPDLYVWDPDGNLVASSLNSEGNDTVSFTAQVSGTYQVEVFAYTAATYVIDFDLGALSVQTSAFFGALGSAKSPRSQPTITTQNAPLMNLPSTTAPIAADSDTLKLFLPSIQR